MTKAVIAHLRERRGNIPIVLTGDLNVNTEDLTKIEQQLNMRRAQRMNDVLPSHQLSNNRRNQLDYTLISRGTASTSSEENFQWSDHSPISTKWTVTSQLGVEAKSTHTHMLKALSEEDEKAIVHSTKWPTRPWIRAATSLRLTMQIKRKATTELGLDYIERKKIQ